MKLVFSEYEEQDSIYVVNLGFEDQSQAACWGPGRRRDGIVHYVLSGEGFFNGHRVKAGQGFYIAPFQLHEYHTDPDNPWTYVWFNCSEGFSDRFVKGTVPYDEHGVFPYDFSGKLKQLYQRILYEKTTLSHLEAMSYTLQILMMHEPAAPKNDPVPLQHMKNAKTYIDSNLYRKFTVQEVADAMYLNDRYLYNLFIQHEGIPVKEYILKKKAEAAADLLETTQLPVKDIAAALGFHDLYSFSKFCKNRMGVSPTAFRKERIG